jgi:hypothetical protein
MRSTAGMVLGIVTAVALGLAVACGHSSGGGGTCPCTIGSPGSSVTVPCGGAACSTLNGVTTGYRCESDGPHEDPTICTGDGGPGDGGGSDGPPNQDAPYEATLLPDGAAPTGECVVAGDAGTCTGPDDCICTGGSCSFACGADESDGGMTLVCGQLHSCGVTCATDCAIDCKQSTSCGFSTGAKSQVDCVQAVGCEGTVGAGSAVDCTGAQSCLVTCTGDCTVKCAQGGGCRVTCPAGEDAGACNVECPLGAATVCPDGVTRVCPGTTC